MGISYGVGIALGERYFENILNIEDNKQALTELQNTISTLQDFLDTTTQP